MRNWSCKSILDKKDKFRQKIDFISNRMIELEKDIEEIKMKNITPILSPKNRLKVKNEKNNNKKEQKNNHNLYFIYNNKKKFFSHNNSNSNIIRKTKSCSIIPRDKLEYEYELRILRRKLESLKETNLTLNNNLNNIREKNDFIEFNINSYRAGYNDNNDINYESNNDDDIILDEINNINYKKKLINKIKTVCKNTTNYYNSYENNQNRKECSILNLLLNIMDLRYSYENAALYNSFLQGVELLIQNDIKKYNYLNSKNKIFNYITDLINTEKKLKIINKEYENSKKYYDLCKKFSSINNLDDFLNKIIMKNIKVEQSINKIKNVLKDDKIIKNYIYNGNKEVKKNMMMEQLLNRNKKNPNYDYERYSFYTTNYTNNKQKDHNYNNFNRKNNFLKKTKNHSNSSSFIRSRKVINTNFNNYIQSRDKKSMNKMKKSSSGTFNNKKPKNFNKLYYNSYSLFNNSKSNCNFNS